MIFLIGMPGAGKTYWAQHLAAAYDLPYVDMDAYMEHQYGMHIPEMFTLHGEDWFRNKEQEALKAILADKPANTIVACGGGTPVFFDNMQLMNEAGCTVYLKAELQTLINRLKDDSNRPLLNGGVEDRLRELLTIRSVKYEQAGYILSVETLSSANFAQIISSCTNRP